MAKSAKSLHFRRIVQRMRSAIRQIIAAVRALAANMKAGYAIPLISSTTWTRMGLRFVTERSVLPEDA